MNPVAPAPVAPQAPVAAPQGTPAPTSAGITAASPQAPTQANFAPPPSYDVQGLTNAIRNYYQIPQAAAVADIKGGGTATQGQQQNTANEISSQWAQKVAEESASASAYRLQQDPQGGPSKLYNIYTGKVVDALSFNKLTGEDPSKIFANSTNKADQVFAQDYQNYESYMQALLNPSSKGNQRLVSDYQSEHPELKNMSVDQLRQRFMQVYSAYFGGVGAAPGSEQFGLPYSPSAESYFAEYAQRPNILPNTPVSASAAVNSSTGNPIGSGVKKK